MIHASKYNNTVISVRLTHHRFEMTITTTISHQSPEPTTPLHHHQTAKHPHRHTETTRERGGSLLDRPDNRYRLFYQKVRALRWSGILLIGLLLLILIVATAATFVAPAYLIIIIRLFPYVLFIHHVDLRSDHHETAAYRIPRVPSSQVI